MGEGLFEYSLTYMNIYLNPNRFIVEFYHISNILLVTFMDLLSYFKY